MTSFNNLNRWQNQTLLAEQSLLSDAPNYLCQQQLDYKTFQTLDQMALFYFHGITGLLGLVIIGDAVHEAIDDSY